MQTQPDPLSTTFAALADPTRRGILARLAQGEATVTELAAPYDLSLPAISKHLKVLQRAGLIEQGRQAQWRPCRLHAGAAARRQRLARPVPAALGGELRSPRRLPPGAAGEHACHDSADPRSATNERSRTMTAARQLGNERTTVYQDGLELVFERSSTPRATWSGGSSPIPTG